MKQVHRPTMKLVKYGKVPDDEVALPVAVGRKRAASVARLNGWDNHETRAKSIVFKQPGSLGGVGSVRGGSRGFSTQPARPLPPPEKEDEFEEIDPWTMEPLYKSRNCDEDLIMSDTVFEEDGGASISEFDSFGFCKIGRAHV